MPDHHRLTLWLPVFAGIIDCLAYTVREGGIRGTYRGLAVSVAEIAPYSGIAFGMNAYLKERFLERDTKVEWPAS